VRSCAAVLMFFAACSSLILCRTSSTRRHRCAHVQVRSFLCRTSSFLCVSSRELLFRLFACSRSATTHPLNSSFFAACLIDPWAFLLPSARRHRCAHVQLRSCSLPPCAAPPPRDDTGALMYRCVPHFLLSYSFLSVYPRELLCCLFACSRSATTHPLNSSFFAAC
jgi:hypothetical protein